MSTTNRLALLLLLLVGGGGCDQATKSAAQHYLIHQETWSLLGDTLRLQLVHNHGAFLSLGAALPEAWRHAVFGIGVAAMLLLMTSYALFSKQLSVAAIVAIALFITGGASNLADRLVYGGYVVDFMNIGIGPLRTGIFNVADIFVMAGAVLLIGTELRRDRTGPVSP